MSVVQQVTRQTVGNWNWILLKQMSTNQTSVLLSCMLMILLYELVTDYIIYQFVHMANN